MKINWLAKGAFIAVALPALVALPGAAQAAFQNWQSHVFEDNQPQENQNQQNNENQQRWGVHYNYQDPASSEASYYRAIQPEDVNQGHNYLLESHPLEEAPLPDQAVE